MSQDQPFAFAPAPNPTSALDWAHAVAPSADPGHWDELRAQADPGEAPLSAHWQRFFELSDIDGAQAAAEVSRRHEQLQRQVRDNGITHNVYANAGGSQRPWSLDLFPMIVGPSDWAHIEAGVLQRTRLLNAVMADLYGPGDLLRRALLPTALVQGHPGYLRAMHGVQPIDGTWLHITAFDLAHGPDGRWWVVSQRTQAPSGLGYLLENRIAVSRQFPQAFAGLKVQRLAASYRALMDGIKRSAPQGAQARIALLTPGPYNESYFEHAYLARYLGLSLVEGKDLTVRDQHLYLKTLKGLEPVHALIKRMDDEWLDPMELRADSTLGVPGLLQVLRAGNLLLANAPGSGPLESSAMLGFLSGISEHLLGESLHIPSLDTWWCGEGAALREVLPDLGRNVVRATYPRAGFDTQMGQSLSPRELDEWAGRMARQPDEHTVQAWMPLSQSPTWANGQLTPRSALLRVFVLSDGPGSWRVLPGGLVRLAPRGELIASMQRGGSSADAWVITQGAVDTTSLLNTAPSTLDLARSPRPVTSRSAENLYWLGRYTERTENTVRLAQLILNRLSDAELSTPALLRWLSNMAEENALVLADVPEATQSARVFVRSLLAGLAPAQGGAMAGRSFSVGFNLGALQSAAAQVRERISQEHWVLIERARNDFAQACSAFTADADNSANALNALRQASERLAAITGAQTDRMMRDDGWRLLSIGRHIERLATLAQALLLGLKHHSLNDESGFDAMVALFDSTITFHAQYQQRRDMVALTHLLVMDRDNPRALAWVVHTLRSRLAKLSSTVSPSDTSLVNDLPDPDTWSLAELCRAETHAEGHVHYPQLQSLLQQCGDSANTLSNHITRLHFSHAEQRNQSLGV